MSLADAKLILDGLETINNIDHRTTLILAVIQELGVKMATLEENLTALGTAVSGIEEDVNRVLEALANEELSPETQSAVDQLKSRIDALNASMDAAVPPAPPENPNP